MIIVKRGFKCNICNDYLTSATTLLKHYDNHTEYDKILLDEYYKSIEYTIYEYDTTSLYNTAFYKNKQMS